MAGFASGRPPVVEGSHLCGATGSPFGPFDFETYEAADYQVVYAKTMALAGHNKLFPELSSFLVPPLESGNRAAGSSQPVAPYIPPVLLKSIAWLESGWAQGSYDPLVQYGEVGPTLVSHDCGYGLMQVTSGMQNVTGLPTLDQAMIGGHYAFNIARGARILADKWNHAPEWRPIVGNRDPHVIENWYYALWAYNGFAFKNHPLNPDLDPKRPAYICDGTQPRSDYPYQELILGCVVHPPVRGGQPLWTAQAVHLPDLANPAFSGPLKIANWAPCSQNLQCAPMDIPTPNPSHIDATASPASRATVVGSPAMSVSKGQLTFVTIPPTVNGDADVMIKNTGTGVLAWRATTTASWLKVSRYEGVALGSDLESLASTVTISTRTEQLPPGVYTADVKIESLYGSPTAKTIAVTVNNYPDGTLLKGSGAEVFVVRRGLIRHVPDAATFEANGFIRSEINSISDEVLPLMTRGRPLHDVIGDGHMLKGSGPAVYVMEGEKRRHLKSPTVMGACQYEWDAVYEISDTTLGKIATGSILASAPCPRVTLTEGEVVRGTGAHIYEVRRGLKRHIPNSLTFEVNGLLWGNVDRLPDSTLASVAEARPLLDGKADGNLIKGSGPAVYVMQAGTRRHVMDPATMTACGYGWDAVHDVSDGVLSALAKGTQLAGVPCPHVIPPHGVLVQGSGPSVYFVSKALKRHVPNGLTFEAMELLWAEVDSLPDSTLEWLPAGDPLLDAEADGSLLKGSGPAVYVMAGGTRRHVASPSVFNACGYKWDAVREVPDDRISALTAGVPLTAAPCPLFLPPDGSLIQGTLASVYVMDAGLKRHVAGPSIMTACGYAWGNVNKIASSSIAAIPSGASLVAPPCP